MIQRAVSGLTLVVVMLTIILMYPGKFWVFWLVVTLIAYLEGMKFSRYSKGLRRVYLASAILWLLSLILSLSIAGKSLFMLFPASLFAFLTASIFLYEGEHDFYFFYDFCGLFATFIYVSVFYSPLFLIASAPQPGKVLLFLFGLMWIQDTLAYFGGRLLGKRKLSRNLSPKKTWEGSLIGMFGAYLLLVPLSHHFETVVADNLFLYVLLVGTAGQIGDLLESFYKRNFGVKDSGTILPGHGGILDRFDSVTAGSIVYLFIQTVLGIFAERL